MPRMKTSPMFTAAASLLVALSAALLSPTVGAVGPQAPFTPPPSAPLSATAAQAASAPDGAASDAEMSTPQGLVGLRLGNTPSALIDGHWVRLGQDVRGARLIDVRQGAVRLRHANGQIETLALFADPTAAALTPRRPPSSSSAAARELP